MTFQHCLERTKKTNNQLSASSNNTFLFSICRIWIVCCIIHFRSYMRVIWLLCAKLSVVIVKDDIINKILCEYQKMWLNCSWLFFFFLASHFVHRFVRCGVQCIRTASFVAATNNEWSNLKYSVRTCVRMMRAKLPFLFMPNIFHWLSHSPSVRHIIATDISVSYQVWNNFLFPFHETKHEKIEHLKIAKIFNSQIDTISMENRRKIANKKISDKNS